MHGIATALNEHAKAEGKADALRIAENYRNALESLMEFSNDAQRKGLTVAFNALNFWINIQIGA